MFLVHSVFTVKYLRISLGCIHCIAAHQCGVRKSICTCIYSFTVLIQHVCIYSKDSNPYSKQIVQVIQAFWTLQTQWMWMVNHTFLWALHEATRKAALPLQTHSNKDVKIYSPFIVPNLTCIALHLHIRPWIPSHHITEIRIRSSISGNTPKHMHTQKKPSGISMKNRPSKKTSSIQMSPQISRESMTTSAVVADEETHTYTPLPPIVLLGHSSN